MALESELEAAAAALEDQLEGKAEDRDAVAEAIEQAIGDTGIEAEVIDIRSLLPFDIHHSIVESLKKTNRIIFIDEDVPGGASAYMMQEVMEKQGGYRWLDSEPQTLAAQPHRPDDTGILRCDPCRPGIPGALCSNWSSAFPLCSVSRVT